MQLSFHRPAIGMILILGIAGCSNRGAISLSGKSSERAVPRIAEVADSNLPANPSRRNTPPPITTASSSSLEKLEAKEDATPTTQLVSATSSHQPPRRTLMTLPRKGNLMTLLQHASGPVVLDFYATWCGPCRTQGQILHDIEMTAAKANALIIKIDVDEHPGLASELGISSLPTLILVRDGKLVHQQTGIASKQQLVRWMQ